MRASNWLKFVKDPAHRLEVDFIPLALQGKSASFDKVIGMIDDMVGVLKKEQGDDVNKKTYCDTQLENLDDAKKDSERAIAHSEKVVAEAQDLLQTIGHEIEAIATGIRALDESVAEAGVQRKA